MITCKIVGWASQPMTGNLVHVYDNSKMFIKFKKLQDTSNTVDI